MKIKRKPLKKRRKRSKKDKAFDKAWIACSQYIRKRDKYICFTCNKQLDKYTSDAGHYIPKSSYSDTMFDEFNLHCQCVGCNKWKHGNLGVYAERIIEKYGIEKLNELKQRRNKVKIWKLDELIKIRDYYLNKLEKMV